MKHRILVALFILVIASPAAAHPAWGIVVDRRGQIYFSDLETVWKRDGHGRVEAFRTGVHGRHVHDLAIDAAGAIYGIDTSYDAATQTFPRALWKQSASGELAYLVPSIAEFPIGQSLWRDSTGSTYSVEPNSSAHEETKIFRRTADGVTAWFAGGAFGHRDGPRDAARFGMITDIAFAADDTPYLTDGGAVRRIDRTGQVTTPFGTADGSRLFGLAVDRDGSVVVADPGGGRVVRVTAGGTTTVIATSESPWSPTGVALRGRDVLVLESWYDSRAASGTRVRGVSPAGAVTELARVGAAPPVAPAPATPRKLSWLGRLGILAPVGLIAAVAAFRRRRKPT